jgi:cytochrome c oxidase subunit II
MEIFPESASSFSAEIDNLFWLIFIIVGVGFVISLFILLYPILMNHHQRKPKADYITGEKRKHFKWVAIAMVVMAVSDFTILYIEHDTWDKTQQHVPDAELHVAIIGKQWNWTFIYPGPDKKLYTIDDVIVDQLNSELHIPINKNIKVDIKAKDVLHSVFIPAFRFKYDAIPGRTVSRWFNATKEGKYDLSCAEICGVLHSNMRNYIVVESQEKYEQHINNLYQSQKSL